MSPLQQALGLAGTVLQAFLLGILLQRGHARSSPIFALYIGWIVTSQALFGLWPEQFYTPQFWLVHKVAEGALRFGVALELAHRIFRGFPGAAASALNLMLVVTAVTAFTTAAIYSPTANYADIIGIVVPRVAQGTAWMFTALAALVLWYRIPLAPLQRAVLMGITPYLLLFAAGMGLLQTLGWHWRVAIGYVTSLSFIGLTAYWTVVAWKTHPVEALPGFAARSPSADRTAA